MTSPSALWLFLQHGHALHDMPFRGSVHEPMSIVGYGLTTRKVQSKTQQRFWIAILLMIDSYGLREICKTTADVYVDFCGGFTFFQGIKSHKDSQIHFVLGYLASWFVSLHLFFFLLAAIETFVPLVSTFTSESDVGQRASRSNARGLRDSLGQHGTEKRTEMVKKRTRWNEVCSKCHRMKSRPGITVNQVGTHLLKPLPCSLCQKFIMWFILVFIFVCTYICQYCTCVFVFAWIEKQINRKRSNWRNKPINER